MGLPLTGIKPCGKCGKRMIKWLTGMVMLTAPEQYQWIWRCNCGHKAPGGIIRERSEAEQFRAEWLKRQA